MGAIFYRIVKQIKKFTLSTVIALVLTGTNSANAVVIDFDDIQYVPADEMFPHFSDNPLTDQYLDKGLLIDGGFLVGESLPDGSNDNQLLGSNFLLLRFVGNLPTYVSMYVSAAHEQAVFLNAFGEGGWLAQKQTSGYAGPYNETPYIDNQLVSFYAPEGISFITLEAFYGLRTGAVVDNLFYDYSTSVPEPSLFILLISGLLMIALSSVIHRQCELVEK
jgi:hypothetical protein